MDDSPGPEVLEPAPSEPRRIRVAWLAGASTLADLARTLQPLAIGLLDELVEITVFCPQGAQLAQLPCPPLEIIQHGRPRWMMLPTDVLDNLAAEVRSRKIQLLHAMDSDALGITEALARRTELPWVLSSYSPGDTRRLRRHGGKPAAILAGSQPVRKAMEAMRNAEPHRIRLIRPGVYLAKGATCFVDPQYSISIVAGGCLDDYGAFEAVLQAFAQLRQRNYDASYFIMGDGRSEQRLRERADQLDIRNEVTFVPSRKPEHLSGIYKAADIYIAPTPGDRVNIQALLAMAAGVPVLAVQDNVSDFLLDGQTAQIYPAAGVAELTAKLTGWLDDQPAASAIAEGALAHLRENHSPARMVLAVAEAYRAVAL